MVRHSDDVPNPRSVQGAIGPNEIGTSGLPYGTQPSGPHKTPAAFTTHHLLFTILPINHLQSPKNSNRLRTRPSYNVRKMKYVGVFAVLSITTLAAAQDYDYGNFTVHTSENLYLGAKYKGYP